MAITPKDIITFRELWKKIALAAGQQNPTEFPFDLFITTSPLVDVFTFYVDPTLGNDANRGDDSLAPKRTIASALASIPKTVSQPYTINLAAGTYAEQVRIHGYTFILDGVLTIQGTMSTAAPVTGNATGTVTSFTSSVTSTGVLSFITDSGQTLTAHDLKGKFIRAANSLIYPIQDNTATTISVIAPSGFFAGGSAYTIVTPGSIIKKDVADTLNLNAVFECKNNKTTETSTSNLNGVQLKLLQIESSSSSTAFAPVLMARSDLLGLTSCLIKTAATRGNCVYVRQSQGFYATQCIFYGSGSSLNGNFVVQDANVINLTRTLVYGTSGTSNILSDVSYVNNLSLNAVFLEKTDATGTVLRLTSIRNGSAAFDGLFVRNTHGSGGTTGLSVVASNWSCATLNVEGVTTGVSASTGCSLSATVTAFKTVTTGYSITKGGMVIAASTQTFNTVPTNEILLDGVQKAFTADLDAASPAVLFNNYGSRIAR